MILRRLNTSLPARVSELALDRRPPLGRAKIVLRRPSVCDQPLVLILQSRLIWKEIGVKRTRRAGSWEAAAL